MKTLTLEGKIKRKAKVILVLTMILLLFGAFLVYMMAVTGLLSTDGYFTPHVVKTMDEMEKIGVNDADVFNVSLTAAADDLVDANIKITRDGIRVGNYIAVFLDKKYILVRISSSEYDTLGSQNQYTFTGELTELGDKESSIVIDDMKSQGISEQDARGLLSKYVINTSDSGAGLRTVLYIITLLFLGAGLFFSLRSALALININNSPQIRRLSAYGPVDCVLDEVENQYEEGREQNEYALAKWSRVYLLKEWIVAELPFNISIINAGDLLWAYKVRQKVRYYGVVTVGSTFFLKLRTRSRTMTAAGKELSIDRLLGAISEKYPWAVMGYNESLEQTWRSDIGKFEAHAREKKTGAGTGGEASASSYDAGMASGEQAAGNISLT